MTAVHRLIYPNSVGFKSGAANWSLESLLSLVPAELERFSRRAIEVAGQVANLDFLIGLPDPVYRHRQSLEDDLGLLVERLEAAFAPHRPLDWLFVSPKVDWLERLSQYHVQKVGVPDCGAISRETSAIRIIDHLAECGFAVAELGAEDILPLLASRFHGLIPPLQPATIEGFASNVLDDALLITSSPQIFGAWQAIQASPLASQLPENWEIQFGKYGLLIPRVLRHFCPEAFISTAPTTP